MTSETLLIIGAAGQLGTELTAELRSIHGNANVIASDINKPGNAQLNEGPFEMLDATDADRLAAIIDQYKVTQVYLLAAILSAKGEQNPRFAWQLNMQSLLNVLEIAREKKLNKVYWPSSIAVFGPTSPVDHTPQDCVMDPNTVYGISKQAGERWCEYYFEKYGVDVRSLRYPGLIGYKALPGGGTTDYAVDIFHKAIKGEHFESFLSENSYLPMMYMPDAIKATIDLMEAPSENVKVRSSYNLSAISFTPQQIFEEIKKHKPDFTISYNPDYRQKIADTWPNSIDDSRARADWNWKHQYDLAAMVQDILEQLPVYHNL
ncbi:NAD-dependent epimerase/dehydratase family protein [Marivirga atlantica]|jgi:nucleoside-diphosphate-sugar epimerase|uniref:NAD-dependent epimerase/dehydratase family protein n=1 Tax=Marivirga atlantica TaxID=1548457 RepID=A0A937DIY9_9BACT|nr:NAD-dependent epimerase/dehydratase family protein [Marivirga atlantica]MBL0764314.1 NAD-dependent epimerase/dehydratase family protein [Marivirga atlantica]